VTEVESVYYAVSIGSLHKKPTRLAITRFTLQVYLPSSKRDIKTKAR